MIPVVGKKNCLRTADVTVEFLMDRGRVRPPRPIRPQRLRCSNAHIHPTPNFQAPALRSVSQARHDRAPQMPGGDAQRYLRNFPGGGGLSLNRLCVVRPPSTMAR